jgi:hypothetical protein
MWCDEPFNVLGEYVHLDVHLITRAPCAKGGDLRSMRNHGDTKRVVGEIERREAHAIDGDRSLFDEQVHGATGQSNDEIRRRRNDGADKINVAEHNVPTESVAEGEWPL